jgi:hypothetical protein
MVGFSFTLAGCIPISYRLHTEASSAGAGARSVTITVNDGTNLLQAARVRLAQGAESYVVSTSASGVAAFSLDDATWTVTISKAGYTFTPTTLVVNGTETQTYSMTKVTTTASDPGYVTGYLYCYDEKGEVVPGVSVELALYTAASTDAGHGYDTTTRSEDSDATGLVQFTNLVPGASYMLRLGKQKTWNTTTDGFYRSFGSTAQNWTKVTVAAAATDPYELPTVWGGEA